MKPVPGERMKREVRVWPTTGAQRGGGGLQKGGHGEAKEASKP